MLGGTYDVESAVLFVLSVPLGCLFQWASRRSLRAAAGSEFAFEYERGGVLSEPSGQ
jgi:hypothetical protein